MKTTPPPDTIGYYGIVIPEDDAFSGYYLVKRPEDEQKVMMTMFNAMATPEPHGALSAVMVEGALTGRPDVTHFAARAYSALTHVRYFVVIGHKEARGTRTEIRELPSESIEAARAGLEALPEVVALKKRIQKGLAGKVPN